MKCSAIYARVSSDKQKEEQTIASQTTALKAYAEAEGYVVPEEWVFEDEGYSGSVLARPGLERIRDLAAEGEIEAVLVYSPDRLSRNYAYQTILIEEFARQGVEVIFLKSPKGDTPEDRLLLQFQGMIAEYERAQIAERSRRGKRHKAQAGMVSVLSGAPYGYRYHKRNEHVAAFYEVLEVEAAVVREVYLLYIEKGLSINAIARHLNEKGIPTRSGKCRWERTQVWSILRNPAYKGTACFGKTESTQRKKITRPLRQKGGYSPRDSSNRERPCEDWIEIPVPAIVSEETYAMAQELLERNKQFASRNTKKPTLLQGLLVCRECGYALYCTSTRTSTRQVRYYRCIGSDNYRFAEGRKCHSRPIRQDYLDPLVWEKVIELLKTPALVQEEINRRIEQSRQRNPILKRQETLGKERARVQNGMDKLLDAYQESLLPLNELRQRMPALQKRMATIESELATIEAQAINQEALA
ncbi:MAG: recombinase family protein, partial [Planctomycetota bacterium]|nr:recombinase family protein [Planctomycetota bacterium]